MRWLLAWVAAATLAAAPAVAGPWDTYQVIMWQDRSAAQMAGLRSLGFTATQLRASGGRIDPAALAARMRSGLPWYLENIATDFYAPYHRYRPGKAVTWLFDAAKSRRRANPADESVFLREPSLSDPAWLSAIANRLAVVVAAQQDYRPLFYNLADEPGIGDLAAAWDADTSPASLAGMREWLQTQYASLDALNQQWGTAFPSWDAVMPELTDAAMERIDYNYSAWADFKAWMDVALARAVRVGTDAVHQADPTALAAIEGTQVPGWGGYDYSLLSNAVDVMEMYDSGNAVDIARSLNPTLISLRTSFGRGPREAHAVWQHVLRGGCGMVVWDEANDVVAPDGSPGPRGQEIAALAKEVNAVFPALSASRPAYDRVVILYSQASFRTRWMLDHRHLGPAWSERDAGREYEDNAWRASRRQAVQRLGEIGILPRFASSGQIEAGTLRDAGLRVLVLPHSIALSRAEATEIQAFMARGGTVLADVEPGLFDQHSRRLPQSLLPGVTLLDELRPTGGTISDPASLSNLALALHKAGVVPRAQLLGPDGLAAVGVDMRWSLNGGTMILALHSIAPWSAPTQVELRLPTAMVIHDLVKPSVQKQTDRLTLDLDPVTPTFLSLVPVQ